MYRKRRGENYVKWSDFKPLAAVNREIEIVLEPGSTGENFNAAYEDIRHAVQSDSELALLVQSAIDTLSNSLPEVIGDDAAHILDGNEAKNCTKLTVPDDLNKTLYSTKLVPCGDSNSNINLSNNEGQGANPHGTIKYDEDLAAVLTYVSLQSGNFHLKAGGHLHSCELRILGHADLF